MTQILIVDDHDVVLHGLTTLINAEPDFSVCGAAKSTAKALKILEKTKADLVLTDVTMQDQSGLELIKKIRMLHPDLPVLVMSMHDELLYAERVLTAGGRGYLMKENSENLIPAIRHVLNGSVYVSSKVNDYFLDSFAGGDEKHFSFPLTRLSDRELEVFELIGSGIPYEDIAEQLGISARTIDAHRAKIREKLRLKDNTALLSWAIRWNEGEK